VGTDPSLAKQVGHVADEGAVAMVGAAGVAARTTARAAYTVKRLMVSLQVGGHTDARAA
jgi:hypothetical protein